MVPNLSDLIPLYYQVCGNAEVLSQAATEVKTVPEFKDEFQLVWSVLTEKAIDTAMKDYRKRHHGCASQLWTWCEIYRVRPTNLPPRAFGTFLSNGLEF